jgi:3'-5' exoribonuclease
MTPLGSSHHADIPGAEEVGATGRTAGAGGLTSFPGVDGRSSNPSPGASAEEIQIATLRFEQEVNGVFACIRKERQISRAGTPYLTVELRDSTGTIRARAFRDADLLAGRFERGELVRVRGKVERFRDELQIALAAIARADGIDADPARFLPTAYRDLDELEGFLEHLAREVYEPGLKGLLARLLGDRALRAEIRRAPCSLPALALGADSRPRAAAGGPGRSGSHHAYLGGLLEHTVAVSTMALELCTLHPRLDRDLLLCAALVHDLGKTREFTYGAEIARSREGQLLGHVELGLRLIASHAPATLDAERRLALEHCVMLHHGADTAAGQRFASGEALALYRLNTLDAQVKGAFEHGMGR